MSAALSRFFISEPSGKPCFPFYTPPFLFSSVLLSFSVVTGLAVKDQLTGGSTTAGHRVWSLSPVVTSWDRKLSNIFQF